MNLKGFFLLCLLPFFSSPVFSQTEDDRIIVHAIQATMRVSNLASVLSFSAGAPSEVTQAAYNTLGTNGRINAHFRFLLGSTGVDVNATPPEVVQVRLQMLNEKLELMRSLKGEAFAPPFFEIMAATAAWRDELQEYALTATVSPGVKEFVQGFL